MLFASRKEDLMKKKVLHAWKGSMQRMKLLNGLRGWDVDQSLTLTPSLHADAQTNSDFLILLLFPHLSGSRCETQIKSRNPVRPPDQSRSTRSSCPRTVLHSSQMLNEKNLLTGEREFHQQKGVRRRRTFSWTASH